MKTYTAHELLRNPGQVYQEACNSGSVRINHGQYRDTVFILTTKPRGEITTDELRHKNYIDTCAAELSGLMQNQEYDKAINLMMGMIDAEQSDNG